jgi:hypothetical protein
MKRLLLIILPISLFVFSCEEEQSEDTTPPSVTITSPQSNSTVYEIITVSCMSSDNEGVEKVEFWLNGVNSGLIDETEPYSFEWNTITIEDGSYSIIIRSYDTNGNTTDSEPINVTVDNTISLPQGLNITSISYNSTEMLVEWEQSTDEDFKYYKVLYSTSQNGVKDTLQTYTDKSITTHSIMEFDPLIENWFWVEVTDTFDFRNIGTGMTNDIEITPPTQPVLNPIVVENTSFVLSWSQNLDSDFKSYTIYESESYDMSNQTEIFSTEDITELTYTIPSMEGKIRFYQIVISDVWGLKSTSNIEEGNLFIIFTKTFGENDVELGRSVQQTTDGGYIILGNSYYDIVLIKTNLRGEEEWIRTFGSNEYDHGYQVQQTTDGGYIITGLTFSFVTNDQDVWLIKTDSQGNEEWNKTFDGYGNDKGFSVQQTTDGGYIISGASLTEGEEYRDGWLIKTDSQGNEEWNKKYGRYRDDFSFSVHQTADDGYIVTGSTDYYESLWLYKTDAEGDSLW